MSIQKVKLDKACEIFGISHIWYRELAKAGHVPAPIKAEIPFVEAVNKLITYYRLKADGQGGTSLVEERTKLTSKRVEKIELELMSMKGGLVDMESVERVIGTTIAGFKSRLLSIPAKVAPIVVGVSEASAQDKIQDAIISVLKELSEIDYEDLRRKENLDKDTKAHKSAAKNDSKRVGRRKKNVKSGGKRRAGKVADVKSSVS